MCKISHYLGERELKAFARLGDLIVPENPPFPSFSHLGCIRHIAIMLPYMNPYDLAGLKILLWVLSFCPSWAILIFLKLLQWDSVFPNFIGRNLRLARVGIKGLVLSLYYSGKAGPDYKGIRPYQIIGYEVRCIPKE